MLAKRSVSDRNVVDLNTASKFIFLAQDHKRQRNMGQDVDEFVEAVSVSAES
jgi:uncharacterized protein YbgA (DUF1722 family)